MYLGELKATLGYTRSMQKHIQLVMAHTFNPSPRESHTFKPSTRGKINWEEREKLSLLSLQSPSHGRGKTSLVFWLLCFLGFLVEPQFLFCLGVFLIYAVFGVKYLGYKYTKNSFA